MDKAERLLAWVKEKSQLGNKVAKTNHAISASLYSFSELGLFEDMSIQPELAIRIWAVVETAMQSGFPEELRM